MTTKQTKTLHPKMKREKKTSEKPISLAGPSFDDVLGALLKTEPMKKKEKKIQKSS